MQWTVATVSTFLQYSIQAPFGRVGTRASATSISKPCPEPEPELYNSEKNYTRYFPGRVEPATRHLAHATAAQSCFLHSQWAKSGVMSSSLVIGLKDVFGNTSDPRHFLEFQTRARPLQLLSGPVEEGFNVRMLVGEPGLGKTALLLRLVQQLQSTALTTRLFLTQLKRSEFLHYFLQELGVPRPAPSFAEAQKQLTSVLERNFSPGRQVMAVIHEAHELKISTLRAVAELLDCPLGRSKQLRVILAGLPVLKVKTASPPLAEFSKRISGIASLGPLTFEESCSYIRQKIELPGFRDDQRFTNDAVALIAKLTGIPETLTISASKPCIGRNSAATGGSTRVWFWRSRPKKAAPVHGLTRKKSHQPRPGSRFSAQRRRLLDLPGQDAVRSSNDCTRAVAHNLFSIRRQ